MLLVGCGDAVPQQWVAGDSGSEILVDTGDRFEIRLESNPSTGFEWQLAPSAGDDVVKLISATYEEPSGDLDLVGAAGIEVFTFEATQTGAALLRLEYVRPFDQPVIPDRIVEFIVRIDGARWASPTGSPAADDD